MVNDITKKINIERLLHLFIFIHVITWTLVPYWVRFTLPMDSMEGASWGQQFEWGYDKNPFLNGWLTSIALRISGESGWSVYLFSQISVGLCFWAIWKLAKKMMPPDYALISVMLLEGVQYYNLHAIDFNDNTLELSLWALTALFLYKSLEKQNCLNWILTGIFAALGMMAKYYTAVMLLPMLLFLLFNSKNRKSFTNPYLYLGLAIFLIIITPHVIWLFYHNFVTVNYAIDRVSTEDLWLNHIRFAAKFTWEQLQTFIPSLLLILFLLFGRKPLLLHPRFKISSYNKQFLFYIGLGPFLLTLLISICSGISLRAGWGAPLLSFWGIILVALVQPRVTLKNLILFLTAFYILMATTVLTYALALIRADAPSSANFPGKVIATLLTNEWHQRYHTPLKYIAGTRWVAGNIGLYSPDHPNVYINWDQNVSPRINEDDMEKHGAIFVWDDSDSKEKLPDEIKARFGRLEQLNIRHFSWLRNKEMKPVEIGVAFLPPEM